MEKEVVQVKADIFRKSGVSMEARGLYATIVSMPKMVQDIHAYLKRTLPDDSDEILHALVELEMLGYIELNMDLKLDIKMLTIL